jgi:hypothetical protein
MGSCSEASELSKGPATELEVVTNHLVPFGDNTNMHQVGEGVAGSIGSVPFSFWTSCVNG